MAIEWNEKQDEAIISRNGTVLVSAAAGSGKSAVLVERVIRRLCDEDNRCPADSLMIVTFTNAAASGLRHKINKALAEKIKDNPKNSYLKKQQRLLSSAVIGTMDSFCGTLVRENFFLTDIEPDFRILDSAQEKLLKSAAIDNVLEKYYTEKTEPFLDLLELFGSDKKDDSLIKNVNSCYDYAIAYPRPEKWIDLLVSEYDSSVGIKQTASGKAIIKDITLQLEKFINNLKIAAQLSACYDKLEKEYVPVIENDIKICEELLELARNGEWDDLRSAVFDSADRFQKSLPTIKGELSNTYEKKTAKALRDDARETVIGFRESMPASESQYKEDCDALKPALECFASIVKDFIAELMRLKREENAYSFSDISHAALDLLIDENGNKTALANELTDRFTEILIDEYQDTNDAQDTLFNSISKEQKNLFIVGDVKQSIYRFRKAMPEIFIQRRDKYALYNKDEDNYPAKIFLDSNYRSRKEVIDTVNFVFSRIMNKNTGDIDYDENEFLNFKADYNNEPMPCEIHFLYKNNAGKMISEEEHVASQIKEMIDSKMQVKDGDNYRDICYSDISILLRSVSKHGEAFANALAKLGIPVTSEANDSFCNQYEVAVMLSLLKAVDNPLNDLAVLSSLYSPLFGFTPDELAEIRLEDPDGNLYSCLKKNALHSSKAEGFLNTLSEFRQLSILYSTGDMLRQIYARTGFDDIVRTMTEGEKRASNLMHLVDFADSFESYGNFGLSEFIRFVDRVTRSGGDIPSDSSAGNAGNSVRIMTIHKSKGLEFPVVFIPKCSYKPGANNCDKALVKLNPKTRLGVMRHDRQKLYRYKTIQFIGTDIQNKYDNVSEELRVFYVAMTRAKEKMIFVVPDGNASQYHMNLSGVSSMLLAKGVPQPIDIIQKNTFTNWILSMAFIASGCEELRRLSGEIIEDRFIEKADYMTFRYFLPEAESNDETEETEKEFVPDTQFVKELESRINYTYPYSSLTGVAAKRTASGFNEETINDDYFASEKPAFMGKQSFTPAQRGTLTHLFMEKCDFSLAAENAETELERLTAEGVFTSEQAGVVNIKAIEDFFKSGLFSRISSSNSVFREQQFTVELPAAFFEKGLETDEQVVVQGKIDCFFIENGEAVIIDYKTDYVKTGEELSDRYSMQMEIYKNAVEQFTGKKVKEVLLYSFALNDTVKII